MRKLIVDNFAGGGGASCGIELATGRKVDIAINHEPAAILMQKTNHPSTEHHIVWPEPTHGMIDTLEVACGVKKPYEPASTIIDWSIPVPSIFDRKKPLADNTLIRIARGIQKYVIEDEPFIINDTAYFLSHYYTHQGKKQDAAV